jgi:hypothetical protein
VGFALSLSIVSAIRSLTYPIAVNTTASEHPPTDATSGVSGAIVWIEKAVTTKASPVVRELQGMLIGRWIGIEGTMTVSSYPQLGADLLGQSLREDPSTGETSLYQRMAGSYYKTDSQFNFGTTPGVIAVLYYSGSAVLVFVGLASVTALVILVEVAAKRLVRNPFVVSMAGLILANAISQMNFPYLFVIFVFELSGTLLLLGFLEHGKFRRRPAPATMRVRA